MIFKTLRWRGQFVQRLVTLLTGIALAVVVGYWLGIGQNTYPVAWWDWRSLFSLPSGCNGKPGS